MLLSSLDTESHIEFKTHLVSVREVFGLDSDWQAPAFINHDENAGHVPEIISDYYFDEETTLAILAGFIHNVRVLLQGYHGTGKSSHIEQVAARLNWPCVRVNLDSNITRMDLIGKDTITLKEGKQITRFQPGMLTWSLHHPVAFILDEYDAGRPDVMFVIQRLLENEGKLTLIDQNEVITPHPSFRLFATANTLGTGDNSGLYHGTQLINQGQMDRWNILATLNYLTKEQELNIVLAHNPILNSAEGIKQITSMIELANLTRNGFQQDDIGNVMSPRNVINFAHNYQIFNNICLAFRFSFYNKCDENDKEILKEYFQRCFAQELNDE